jgi:hypothetical protein
MKMLVLHDPKEVRKVASITIEWMPEIVKSDPRVP